MAARTIVLVLLLAYAIPAQAQDQALPQEAPLELFQLSIGDAEVDFTITGSWSISLYLASGLTFKPNTGPIILDSFPEIATGFYFNQVPDVSFTLWVLERFFFELSYEGTFADNKFRAGYEGKEDEFLRNLYVGNKDVTLSGYRFLNVPASSYSSLGASVMLEGPGSKHEALVRLESNTKGKKIFVGKNEANEYAIHPEEYALGRYFRLPDAGVTNYSVYIQDPLGGYTSPTDGTRYREATIDDASIDPVEGTVWMKKDFPSRILVYYTKGAFSIGSTDASMGVAAIVADSGLPDYNINLAGAARKFDFGQTVFGEDMANRRISVAGRDCLLLWEPGAFSPFEISSAYLLPRNLPQDTWMTRITTVIKGSVVEKPAGVLFRGIPLSNRFIAYINQGLRIDFANLYPFPDTQFHSIYGPGRKLSGSSTDYDILAAVLTPVSDFYLEEKVIPGSVRVTRNGVEESAFGVDYASGRLSFKNEINPDDRIEVTYGLSSGLFDSGDLVFAWGNRFMFSENLQAELSSGLRWNMLSGAYTQTAYSRTGSLALAASISGKYDALTFDATAGVTLSNPDTTGIFRLLGMERAEIPVSLSQETAYPASPPSNPSGCDESNRGRLFFKDYRLYGLLGDSTLQPITWGIPSGQVYAYETGSKPGPYEVSDTSGYFPDSRYSIVEDFSIPALDKWVGIQIPLVSGNGPSDLSEADSISISYKTMDMSTAELALYLQIGEISEDIDGDTALDAEPSASSAGFEFNDSSNSANMRIGSGPKNTGNARKDTEDIDGSGFADPEVATRVVSVPQINIPISSSQWGIFTYSFTEADKKMLSRTRGIQVIVFDTGVSGGSGKLLIDRITISGSSFWKEASGVTLVTSIKEISETLAIDKPAQMLHAKYPSVAGTFHKSGQEQKVLEVSWAFAATGPTVTNRFLPGAGGIEYANAVYYMRIPQLSSPGSGAISYSLTDANGKKVTWSHTADIISEWQEMRIDVVSKSLLMSGAAVPGAVVSVDKAYNYAPVSFSVSVSGNADGLLYLDELHLRDPAVSIGAAFEGNFGLNLAGDLVKAGDIPVIGDLSVSQKLLYTSPGYAPLYGEPRAGSLFSSITDFQACILFSQMDVHLDVSALDSQLSVSPGHKIKIPKDESVVNLTDAYRITQTQGASQVFRENTLRLAPAGDVLTVTLASQSYSISETIVQSWPFSASFMIKDLLNVSAHTGYSESKSEFVSRDDFYFESWIRDFALILPYDGGVPAEQKGDAGITVSLVTVPVGFSLEAAMGFHDYNYINPNRTSSNTLGYGFSIPLSLSIGAGKNLVLQAGYRRRFELQKSTAGQGSLQDDLVAWLGAVSVSPYVFDRVPIVELFDSETEGAFAQSGAAEAGLVRRYKPEVYAGFTKPAGSSILDLVFPSQGEISFSKQFTSEQGIIDFRNMARLALSTSAINLFGKIGTYPLSDFFITDDYMLSFLMNLEFADTIIKGDSYIDSVFTFRGDRLEAFSISSQLRIQSDVFFFLTERCTLAFEWGVHPESGVMLPIVSEETGKSGFWLNKEELAVIYSSSTREESIHPVTILATHTTGLSYPEKGYIRGLVSVGLDFESAGIAGGPELYTRFAFKIGIEGQLKW